jgi:DNA polymerase III subunit alpha
VAGMVTKFRAHTTKDGNSMGFATIEDIQGFIELVIFPRSWEKFSELVKPDAVLLVSGKPDCESGDPKVLVDRIEVIDLSKPLKKKNGTKKGAEPVEESTPDSSAQAMDIISDAEPDWASMPPMPDELDIAPAPEGYAPAVVPVSNGWPGVSSGGSGSSTSRAEPVPGASSTQDQPVAQAPAFDPDTPTRRLTVMLTPTGDRERDKAKLVRAHAILRAYPGNDRFDFMLYENNQHYQMDFPNQPTNICDDMLITLKLLVGEENITIHEAA